MNNFREFWIYLKKLLKLGEYSSREIKKEEKRLLKIKQEEAKERGRLQVIESEKKKAAKIEEEKKLALQKEKEEEQNALLKEQEAVKKEEDEIVEREKARLEAQRLETEKSIRLKAEEMETRKRKKKEKEEKEQRLALEKELEERQKTKVVKEDKPKLPILIVEDSVINQKIMNMIITKMGFETVLAENGQVAVDLAKKQEFSLILMDIEMPIKDGIEASKEIFAIDSIKRQEKRLIIALTSNDTDSHIEEYLAIGMRECISKPVNAEGIKTLFGKYKLL